MEQDDVDHWPLLVQGAVASALRSTCRGRVPLALPAVDATLALSAGHSPFAQASVTAGGPQFLAWVEDRLSEFRRPVNRSGVHLRRRSCAHRSRVCRAGAGECRRRQPDQGCAGRRRDASQGIAFTAIRREAARRHLQTDKGNALQNLLTATAVIEAATGPVLVAHPSLPASRGVDRQRSRALVATSGLSPGDTSSAARRRRVGSAWPSGSTSTSEAWQRRASAW